MDTFFDKTHLGIMFFTQAICHTFEGYPAFQITILLKNEDGNRILNNYLFLITRHCMAFNGFPLLVVPSAWQIARHPGTSLATVGQHYLMLSQIVSNVYSTP